MTRNDGMGSASASSDGTAHRTRVSVRLALVAAALLFAPLAGCGRPANSGAPPPPPAVSSSPSGPVVPVPHTSWDVSQFPDPCRTITGAELGGVLGYPVEPGHKVDSWPPLCQFVLSVADRLFLYISDDHGTTGREDYDRKRSSSPATEAVSGLGDQAYWQPDIAQLHVLKGDTHVFVGFGGVPAPSGAKDKALAIARLMLPRAADNLVAATPVTS